eukprot:3753379-Rhodomonas_salina.1
MVWCDSRRCISTATTPETPAPPSSQRRCVDKVQSMRPAYRRAPIGFPLLTVGVGVPGMELGQQPPALRSLGLADNGISSKGAAALGDALEQNSTLTELQLGTQHRIAKPVLERIGRS